MLSPGCSRAETGRWARQAPEIELFIGSQSTAASIRPCHERHIRSAPPAYMARCEIHGRPECRRQMFCHQSHMACHRCSGSVEVRQERVRVLAEKARKKAPQRGAGVMRREMKVGRVW